MKNILVIALLLLLITSCSNKNDIKDEDYTTISDERLKETKSPTGELNLGNELSVEEVENIEEKIDPIKGAYNEIIILNKLGDIVSESTFNALTIIEGGKVYVVVGKKRYLLGKDDKTIIKFFKEKFNNYSLISEGKAHKDVIESDVFSTYRSKGRDYVYYNASKKYLFTLATFYEMNSVCSLVFGEKESFTNFEGDTVKPETPISPLSNFLKSNIDFYKDNLGGSLLDSKELNNIDFSQNFDSEQTKEILFSLSNEYTISGEKDLIDDFMKVFYNNLHMNYSYEVYTLFLTYKKLEGNDAGYCETFNKEFFLGQ